MHFHSKRIRIKIRHIWAAFFISKILYMFFALLIYSKLTTLGDTYDYLSGRHFSLEFLFIKSTYMLGTLAYSLNYLFGTFFANIFFMLLSFFGIYYAVSRIVLSKKQLTVLLLLLSTPSFGVWTSIASKESIGVFYMGIILGFIIDLIKRKRKQNYLLIILAFYLCLLFKPQYLIGIVMALSYISLSYNLKLKGIGNLLLLFLVIFISISLLYIFRHEINNLSFIIPSHFNYLSFSTRENLIFLDDFDVFWNTPYGIYISFIGPTIEEALKKDTHLLAFIESYFILILFAFSIIKLSCITYKTLKINIFYLSIYIIVTFWILFVNYPFGVMNPGSAIRYRENYYSFFVILFYFFYTTILRKYYTSKKIIKGCKCEQLQ